MELRQLRYFVAVARYQHFTHAAAAVGVAQPAISQQIQLLERELGVSLIDRSGRHVRLTDAGQAFLIRAERILTEVASAVTEIEEFTGLVRGRVVVGVLPSLAGRLMPRLLAAFRAQHPGLDLTMREASSANLLALLQAGGLDLALVHLPESDARAGDIAVEALFTEELVAVIAPEHQLATRDAIPLCALRDEPLLLSQPGSGIRQVVLDAVAGAGFGPRIAFESSGVATLRAMAAEGLGVAILPLSEAIAAGPAVAVVTVTEPALARTVALAWSTNHYQTSAARAFLDHVRRHVARA